MRGAIGLALLSLALAACVEQASRSYVVRLDLDRIAAQTAERDASPGFTSVKG